MSGTDFSATSPRGLEAFRDAYRDDAVASVWAQDIAVLDRPFPALAAMRAANVADHQPHRPKDAGGQGASA